MGASDSTPTKGSLGSRNSNHLPATKTRPDPPVLAGNATSVKHPIVGLGLVDKLGQTVATEGVEPNYAPNEIDSAGFHPQRAHLPASRCRSPPWWQLATRRQESVTPPCMRQLAAPIFVTERGIGATGIFARHVKHARPTQKSSIPLVNPAQALKRRNLGAGKTSNVDARVCRLEKTRR